MKTAIASGVIHAAELYTLAEFRRRLRLSESGMRALRRRGLPVIRVGKRAFVTGKSALDFMEGFATDERSRLGS